MNELEWWAPWGVDEHCRLWSGTRPLLISLPHDGVALPDAIAARMTPAARAVPDTDWHVGRLYDFARSLGASILRPRWSRYVVDLNRPPDGAALYPGKSETGLTPTSTFACEAIYLDGAEPDTAEREQRVERYWRPYHTALESTLAALRAQHGKVLLWEGHSIVGTCPLFFAGRLPDYNLGTAEGRSCGPAIEQALVQTLAESAVEFAHNGRFKGGYITRHYGQPANAIHAVQMELVQANYMDEGAPFAYHEPRASATSVILRGLLERALGALEQA
jgi:N-formylglutamate deformylase